MSERLKGKVAVVTGASKGIGAAIATELAIVVEAMNDLPYPVHGTAHQRGNEAIGVMAHGQHDDPGTAIVHGVASLVFQTAEFGLFIGAQRAYFNSVFHGRISRGEGQNTLPWRCCIPRPRRQLRPSRSISMSSDGKVTS